MCVIVDKLDKIGADAVVELLVGQGVAEEAGRQIVASLSLKSVDELKGLMGDTDDGGAVEELVTIFEMAEAYGFGMLPRVVEPSPYPEPEPYPQPPTPNPQPPTPTPTPTPNPNPNPHPQPQPHPQPSSRPCARCSPVARAESRPSRCCEPCGGWVAEPFPE